MGTMKEQVSSIDLTSEQLHLVRELLREHIPHAEVWAYGSRVKWTSTPKSDLDLVAHVGKEARGQICALREAFEESSLPFRVDLFVWDDVPVEFHAQIESGYFVIQAKNKSSICVKTTLGQVLNFRRGHDLPKSKMRLGDIPVAGSNGCIGYHDSFTPISPCITIGRSGNIGIPYFYHQCWAHNTTLYIDNFKGNNPLFLYYYIKTLKLEHYASGSAVPTLNRNHIHPLDIDFIADLQTQKQIAHVLSTIDKKIGLNQRINENLEQQAQAIFKSWFVKFELFDGVMPSEWKILTLADVCSISAGGDKPNIVSLEKTSGCTIPIYSNGISKEGLYGYTTKARVFEESVTVSARGTIGFTCLRQIPYFPIVRLISLIPKREAITTQFIYLYLLTQRIEGFGTTQQQLTVPSFRKQTILVPDNTILKQFENITKCYFSVIARHKEEIEHLTTLRDTLLPKLMSGEIGVSQVKL